MNKGNAYLLVVHHGLGSPEVFALHGPTDLIRREDFGERGILQTLHRLLDAREEGAGPTDSTRYHGLIARDGGDHLFII